MSTMAVDARVHHNTSWLSWFLGGALFVAVVAAGLQFSEQQAFVEIAERAQPWWLGVAVLLQAATYVAQGGIWRRVVGRGDHQLGRRTAFELSLAKLFADQALPSAGLSSGVLIAKALELRDLPPPAVKAAVLINIASYHLAYAAALSFAFAFVAVSGGSNPLIIITSVAFLLFSAGLSTTVLALAGRPHERLARVLHGFRLPAAIDFLAQADGRLVRSPRLLVQTIALQGAIILFDAATLWSLILALGSRIPFIAVFASFMVASLFRTMGIVPGGLGTFEATSLIMLRTVGVDVAVALSATLLFRGLSFWLPMLPGYWFSRRALAPVRSIAPESVSDYWAVDVVEIARRLGSSINGLSREEASRRLVVYGANEVRERHRLSRFGVFGRQLRSPLLLLLVFAAVASALTGEWLDASIVITIVIATVAIGYVKEYGAEAAAAALRARLRTRTTVVRDGRDDQIPIEDVVPGDVVRLLAGSLVPADAVIVESADFYISEAVLTGESFPVQKSRAVLDGAAPLRERRNCVFLGTNVRSGSATCLVVATGRATEFGTIAHRLTLRPPETEFDRGIRHFGYLLTSAMLIMVLVVFVAHMFAGRPPVETLLFSVALAVGLSPELLPAILNVNLARGAQAMAQRGVLVRRLNAIENLGSMNVLCTDKTGTITEGVVQLEGAYDAFGRTSDDVLRLGACNAALETGLASALDEAIATASKPDLTGVRKLAEIPFDFMRKRVTVAINTNRGTQLVMKGAFHHVLDVCSAASDGTPLDDAARTALERRYDEWSAHGIRVLAVAARSIEAKAQFSRDDECDMRFMGFLTFIDRPKEGVADAIAALDRLGVSVKVITGDSGLVARHIATMVGLRSDRILTGRQLDELHDEALWHAAERTDLFVEVDPNQKERIILSLKKMGHVVGFLGDGVNDAPAMHAADTSLSVEQAVDVARAAADFVLLERGLDVIRRGIEEGRKTFANTLKYVLITTSANLGNMVSMAAASLFLPFLPLTAGQILLNNFVSDIPAVGIAGDTVDPELIDRPRRWDMRFIGRFMIEFGLVSSAFDFLTFATLLSAFHAAPEVFRTGWFVESLLTELVIALVVRTRRPFFQSRPGRVLLVSTMVLIPITFAIPYAPYASVFGFVPLPGLLVGAIATITVLYVFATELLKRRFYA